MGMYAVHEDQDKVLELSGGNVIFLNDLDTTEDKVLIERLAMSSYQGGTFNNIAACQCGVLNKKDFPETPIGTRCQHCLTKMVPYTDRRLSSALWVRAPDKIPSLILPRFLSSLIAHYTVRNQPVTIIHWLLDPSEKLFTDYRQISYMEHVGIKRGLKYFLEHTDFIMMHLNNPDIFGGSAEQQQLYAVYRKDKELLFPKHLPITDKSFNVIERSHLGNYLDVKTFNPYLSAINLITGMKNNRKRDSLRYQEVIIAKFLFKLVEYYENYINGFHNKKSGEYRRHAYGGRLPWTTRQVIVSISEAHDFDEIWLPWSASVVLFEHQLTNYMFKDGYTPNEAKNKILNAINNYDEYIGEKLDWMIANSPSKTTLSGKPGIALLDNRNPTLKQASIQCAYVTKIKKDPKDISCNRSVLTLGGQNADFDGEFNRPRVM